MSTHESRRSTLPADVRAILDSATDPGTPAERARYDAAHAAHEAQLNAYAATLTGDKLQALNDYRTADPNGPRLTLEELRARAQARPHAA